MYAKRIRCEKCGRTLVTGCAKNVEEITCSCGHVTYPQSAEMKKEMSKTRLVMFGITSFHPPRLCRISKALTKP